MHHRILTVRIKNEGRRDRTRFIAIGFVAVAMSALASTAEAQAAEDRYDFHIEAGTLGGAMKMLVDVAGVQLYYPHDLAGATELNPVVGQFTVDEALKRLFEGTEFSTGRTKSGVIVISLKKSAKAHDREKKMASGKVKKSLLASVSAFIFGAGAQGAALAQDGADSGPERDVIVVTARFRDEKAQDIGASIQAFDGDGLSKRGIVDFEDLARSVAGLNNLKTSQFSNDVSIRGVSNAYSEGGANFFASSALVSIYVDDVAVTSSGLQKDFNFFDFNRIEVLRGPQPTLFGEGSVGGTLRYFTADPDLDGSAVTGVAHGRFESIKEGGVAYRGENATSLILVPGKLGVRLTGFYRQDDGFIDNPFAGVDDANDYKSVGGRAVVLARPSDELEIRLSAFLGRDEIGETNLVDVDPVTNTVSDLSDPTFSSTPIVGDTQDDFDLYSGRISYDFGSVEVTSITGYYERRGEAVAFNPGNSFGFPALLDPADNIDTTIFDVGTSQQESFSQELRVVTDFEGPLNLTAGLFYQNVDRIARGKLDAQGFTGITSPSRDFIADTNRIFDNREISGFVEFTYDVSDRLRLIGGTRYIDELLTGTLAVSEIVALDFAALPYGTSNPIPIVDFIPLFEAGLGTTSFDFELKRFLPRGGIEYKASDDILLYANAATGVRNGGLDQELSALAIATARIVEAGGDPNDPDQLLPIFLEEHRHDSDSVVSVDWGIKSQWLDDRLLVNLGLFYTKYKDTQITVQTPAGSAINGPDQRIMGLEFESVYHANDYITGFLNFSIIDAEFTERLQSFLDFAVEKGNSPINIPTLTLSAGYDVNYPVSNTRVFSGSDLNLIASGTFNYVGERFTTPENFAGTLLPSVESLGFQLGIENERFTLKGFVTNALNDVEPQFQGINGLDPVNLPLTTVAINRPRTFGVDLTIRY